MSVPDAHMWHTQNLRRHSNHYSMMAKLGGASFVTWLQSSFGARIYFHPYVDLDISGSSRKQQIKYGVVSTSDLISDLRCWDYLYLAGRMHKPIVSVSLLNGVCLDENQENENKQLDADRRREEIRSAQQKNLLAAVSTSLLLIGGEMSKPDTSSASFNTRKLYATIASLSYTGDFRMQTGAEDPNKVAKLVETPGMLDLWERMYADTLNNLQEIGLLSMIKNSDSSSSSENEVEFDLCDVEVRKHLMDHLPPRLRKYSDTIVGSSGISNGSIALRNELAKIVAPAARNQGLKGIFTAGPLKSWKYALAKFAKGRLKKETRSTP